VQKTYKTAALAAAAFIRNGKKDGTVMVLGGGWWKIRRIGNVQGLGKLEVILWKRGQLQKDGDQVTLTVDSKPVQQQWCLEGS
jgi:hypothetical protein